MLYRKNGLEDGVCYSPEVRFSLPFDSNSFLIPLLQQQGVNCDVSVGGRGKERNEMKFSPIIYHLLKILLPPPLPSSLSLELLLLFSFPSSCDKNSHVEAKENIEREEEEGSTNTSPRLNPNNNFDGEDEGSFISIHQKYIPPIKANRGKERVIQAEMTQKRERRWKRRREQRRRWDPQRMDLYLI